MLRDAFGHMVYMLVPVSVVQKQLMESLRKKLGVLREAQRGLQEDIRANALLGDQVSCWTRI